MATRPTNAIWTVGLFLGITAVAFGAYSYWYVVGPWHEFKEEQRIVRQTLERLESMPPPGVVQRSWEELLGPLYNAYGNVTFSPHYEEGTLHQMRRFRSDLDQYLAAVDNVDVNTVRWIYYRLGEFGPGDKAYIEKFAPSFEAIAQAVEP